MHAALRLFPSGRRLRGLRRVFGLALLGLVACQGEPTAGEVPAYLEIAPFALRTDPGREGSASEAITEGWLSLDGQFLGAYTLPATVPVLGPGERQLTLRPGIRDNGIGTTPETYPFYQAYDIRLDLQPGPGPAINPVTTYTPDTRFSFIEDFERGRPVFGDIQLGGPENALVPDDEEVFEGRFSGRIRLTRASPVVQIATLDRYRDLAAGGAFLYLELNFRSEVPVVFGLVGYRDAFPDQPIPVLDPGFLPSDTWKKIYFNLSPLLLQVEADAYQVALQASIPQENGDYAMEEATIWLDNLKLVHF